MNYRVKNWPRYQHYSTRNPPWIKLYRTIVTVDRDFMRLPWEARAIAPFLWLLAAENEGLIYGPDEKIAEDLRWPERDARTGIKALLDNGFLSIAGDLLASTEQPAMFAPSKPDAPPAPDCPHEQIIAAYHELLPGNPRVRFWTASRRGYLRARWLEDPKRQSLDWWRRYFEHVSRSPFLTGKTNGRGDQPPFVATLEWLVKPSNMVKVIEGNYDRSS